MIALVGVPVVETARLRLRAPRMDDFEAYAAFLAGARSTGVGGPFPRGEAFQKFCALVGQWPLRGFGRWIVADRATDAALGVVGLLHPIEWPEPEIAWTVFDPAEGRGIAAEAARAARDFAYRRLGWRTAISLTGADNLRSQALAQRLGCVRDGVFVHPEFGELLVWRHPAPEAVQAEDAA